jgi:hypothetical protein
VSTSEVPVTDTLSYAFNTGAVIIGVGLRSWLRSCLRSCLRSRAGAGSVKGVGAGSVKGVGAGVDSTVTGSAGIGSERYPIFVT